jgi:hypothetical protein
MHLPSMRASRPRFCKRNHLSASTGQLRWRSVFDRPRLRLLKYSPLALGGDG